MQVLILGADGFLGSHLSRQILENTPWQVTAMDLEVRRLGALLGHPRMHFTRGDMVARHHWVDAQVAAADVVVPLAAIATPSSYVSDPIRVFELDFEANLRVIRSCVQSGTRLVFPSSSEVYGMCTDPVFHPETSPLVLGPIQRSRWIYASCKQLLDRIIWAYGQHEGLDFSLFRPFNWIGPGQDDDLAGRGPTARVVPQFVSDIVRGEPLRLVGGGLQRRTFTDIDDGIEALVRIIANPAGVASGHVYNIGNPANECSIRELAELLLDLAADFAELRDAASALEPEFVTATDQYGAGYDDLDRRTPDIEATTADLGWRPKVPLEESLRRVLAAACEEPRVTAGF